MINDANILIDLLQIDLLESFFKLEFEFHIGDMVLAEVQEQNNNILMMFVDNGTLIINTSTFEELLLINSIRQNSVNLSIPDCSCLFLAKKFSATLLTGDGALRKRASQMNLSVHGILWVFDELLRKNTITTQQALEKLNLLREKNNRLPSAEIDKRLDNWNKRG
jgi:predicted nucleic acid-binding protein